MFHFAPPLCAGSGVRICSPDWVRSFQFSMCLGVPGRTMKPTNDDATIELSWSFCQSWVISPAFCTRPTSGSSEEAYTSAGNPFTMFVACVVLPANDIGKMTFWPLCESFQSEENVDVSLPYASYGLLYAARVMTGESDGLHDPPLPPDDAVLEPPQAAATDIKPAS